MNKNIIDKERGTLFITDDFSISSKTTIAELEAYWGLDRLDIERGYKEYENATIRDLKIKDWFFTMAFYYDGGQLKLISFYPRDKEIDESSWDNFNPEADMIYYTQWMAVQLNDTSNFKWNLNQAGRHYQFSYAWGSVGVFYDFKGGTFSCMMDFKA